MTKSMKKRALISGGMEFMIPDTNFRIVGNAFTVFRGLNILKALSGLRDNEGMGVSSNMPKITAIKSIQFQASLR
jgi:hypothetical protein